MVVARALAASRPRTATDLAAEFATRVNEHGWCWLSAKQTAWLRSLVQRDMARAGGRLNSETVAYTSHGWPTLEGVLPGGQGWRVVIHHNGAGRFGLES